MTPRAKFIKESVDKKVAARAWDAMSMASTHDPDLLRRIVMLECLVSILREYAPRDVSLAIDNFEGSKQYRDIQRGKI